MHMYARGAFAASVAFLTLAGCGGGIDTQTATCSVDGPALVSVDYPGKTADEIAEHVIAFVSPTVLSDASDEVFDTLFTVDGKAEFPCVPVGCQGCSRYVGTVTFVWRSP